MMAFTSSIELTFLLGSNPLPVDRKLRAQFFILVGKTKKKAREIRTVNEKVKHIKLEVMRPKTKSNMNFQPE